MFFFSVKIQQNLQANIRDSSFYMKFVKQSLKMLHKTPRASWKYNSQQIIIVENPEYNARSIQIYIGKALQVVILHTMHVCIRKFNMNNKILSKAVNENKIICIYINVRSSKILFFSFWQKCVWRGCGIFILNCLECYNLRNVYVRMWFIANFHWVEKVKFRLLFGRFFFFFLFK